MLFAKRIMQLSLATHTSLQSMERPRKRLEFLCCESKLNFLHLFDGDLLDGAWTYKPKL